MIRTLFIIAAAGLVLATASLGGAFALGGRDLARHGWEWTFHDHDGDTVTFERDDGTRQPEVTRTLAWTGGQTLTIDLSANVEYVQGDTPGVAVIGPADLVERVRLDGSRLSWVEDTDGPEHERVVFGRRQGGRGIWLHSDQVRIVVTAPNINTFDLEGSSGLSLTNYDQDTLSIDISGSGEVSAAGKARTLELDISGSGEADLKDLTLTDANVAIAGSGDAALMPTGDVQVTISGSGDVDLLTRPANLRQDVSGSGDVDVSRTTVRTTRELARVPGVSVSTSREVAAP